jgi:hypothetical protein
MKTVTRKRIMPTYIRSKADFRRNDLFFAARLSRSAPATVKPGKAARKQVGTCTPQGYGLGPPRARPPMGQMKSLNNERMSFGFVIVAIGVLAR